MTGLGDLAVPRAWSVLVEERALLTAQGGTLNKPIEDAWHWAGIKAHQFLDCGSAYVSHSPGNGTAYPLFLHDLQRAQYEACLFDRTRHLDPVELATDHDLRARVEQKAREAADRSNGAEGYWGGRLLIAMPGFRRSGASIAVALMDYYHHGYLGETLKLNYPDAVPVAEFLSLFGSAVLQLEQQAES